MNGGVNMCCKSVVSNFFTVVVILVEPGTAISKPKSFPEASLSVRQTYIAVTSIVVMLYIPPYLALSSTAV